MSAPSAVLERQFAPSLETTVDAKPMVRDNYCPDCGGAPTVGDMIEDCSEAWTMIPFPKGSWAC